MSAYGGDDVQEKLYDLEQEELRIVRELMELDDVADTPARTSSSPRGALDSLLAECERDVRNAKGYIQPGVQPIQIVRVVAGAGKVPKSATYLSRPKGTGVDFTVPVTLPEYLQAIKSPIFLNDIRDKCLGAKYDSPEDYLEDMRLLARNTATFNRGADLSWVVQHARLLLEAAEEAVATRRGKFEAAALKAEANAQAANAPGKRRRSAGTASKSGATPGGVSRGAMNNATSAAVAVERARGVPPPPANSGPMPSSSSAVTAGIRLFIFWPGDRLWYKARVVKKMSVHRAEVVYDDDSSRQVVDLRIDHWRPIESSGGAGGRSRKGTAGADPPPNKRQKGLKGAEFGAEVAQKTPVASVPLTRADLDEFAESWFTTLEQFKTSILDDVHDRFDRIERAANRGDAMRRVLFAVNDLSDVVTEETKRLREHVTSVEERLDQKAERDFDREARRDTIKKRSGGNGVATAVSPGAENSSEGLPIERTEKPKNGSPAAPEKDSIMVDEEAPASPDRESSGKDRTHEPAMNISSPKEKPTSAQPSNAEGQEEVDTGRKDDADGSGNRSDDGMEETKVATEEATETQSGRDHVEDPRGTDGGAAESTVLDATEVPGDSAKGGQDDSSSLPEKAKTISDGGDAGRGWPKVQGADSDGDVDMSAARDLGDSTNKSPVTSKSPVEPTDKPVDEAMEDVDDGEPKKEKRTPEKDSADSEKSSPEKMSTAEKAVNGPSTKDMTVKEKQDGDPDNMKSVLKEKSEGEKPNGGVPSRPPVESSRVDDDKSQDGDSSSSDSGGSSSSDDDGDDKKSEDDGSDSDSSDDESPCAKSLPRTRVVEAAGEQVNLNPKENGGTSAQKAVKGNAKPDEESD